MMMKITIGNLSQTVLALSLSVFFLPSILQGQLLIKVVNGEIIQLCSEDVNLKTCFLSVVEASDNIFEGTCTSSKFKRAKDDLLYVENHYKIHKIFKGGILADTVKVFIPATKPSKFDENNDPIYDANEFKNKYIPALTPLGTSGIIFTTFNNNVKQPKIHKNNELIFQEFSFAINYFLDYEEPFPAKGRPFSSKIAVISNWAQEELFFDDAQHIYDFLLAASGTKLRKVSKQEFEKPTMEEWIKTKGDKKKTSPSEKLTPSIPLIENYTPSTPAGNGSVFIIEGDHFGNSPGEIYFDDNSTITNNYIKIDQGELGNDFQWSNDHIEIVLPSLVWTKPSTFPSGNFSAFGLLSDKFYIQTAEGIYSEYSTDYWLTIPYSLRTYVTGNSFSDDPTTRLRTKIAANSSSGSLEFEIHQDLFNNITFMEILNEAMNAWVCATGINWKLGQVVSSSGMSNDGKSTLGLGGDQWATTYESGYNDCNGEYEEYIINEFDIYIHPGLLDQPEEKIYGTLLHELGHAHGLLHTFPGPADITLDLMTPGPTQVANNFIPSQIYSDDLIGAKEILTFSNQINCSEYYPYQVFENISISPSSIESAIFPPTSCYLSNGSVYFRTTNSISGGVSPYTYLWNTGATSLSISNLSPGIYTLTITDANNCTGEFNFDMTSSDSPEIELLLLEPQCEGTTNGSIWILAYSNQASLFDFEWNNGFITTNDFESFNSELEAGTYSVTVTVISTGCTSTASFEVPVRASTGTFSIGEDVNNTCPGVSSGSVSLLPTGGNPPYSYFWNTGSEEANISNIGNGNYQYTVTDDCGRTINSSVSVGTFTEMSVEVNSISGCPGNIDISVSGGSPPYQYFWENGQTSSTVTNLINNRNYCVTISDSEGCVIEECFFVPIDDSAFDIYISEIQHVSNENPTGSCTVAGETPGHYTYIWSTGTTGSSISNVVPGVYSVTVSNSTGCSVTRTIIIQDCNDLSALPDFEIWASGGMFISLSDPDTEVSALIKEEGSSNFTTNIPSNYSIRWEFLNTTFIGSNQTQTIDKSLIPGLQNLLNEGFTSVRLIISNGCVEKSINHFLIICGHVDSQWDNIISDFFISETFIEKPCEGFSDGSIYIEIPNPDNLPISVFRDGIEVPMYNQDGISFAQIGGLGAGGYDFQISIGDCTNNFAFGLGSEPFDIEFINYDPEEEICIYEESCKGNVIGTFNKDRIYDADNGSSLPCLVPIQCDGKAGSVGVKRYRQRGLRVFEYKKILETFFVAGNESPFLPEYIDQLMGIANQLDDCDRIRYCPANLKITGTILGNIPIDNFVEPMDENGCFRVNCFGVFNIPFHFNVCLDDLNMPDDIINEDIVNGVNECNPVSANLFLLYNAWQNYGALEGHPQFDVSILKDILNDFGPTPEAKCATIIYCASDLTILYNDIEYVNCGTVSYQSPRDFEDGPGVPACNPPLYSGEGYEVVMCNVNGAVGQRLLDYSFYPQGGFTEGDTSEQFLPPKFDLDTFYYEKLNSLGFIADQGALSPFPIIETDYNNSLYYNFHPKLKVIQKSKQRNTKYLLDDWDSEETLFCYTNQPLKEYEIAFYDENGEWSKILESTIDLDIYELSKEENKLVVSGYFSGKLSYNGVLIDQSQNGKIFFASIDKNGNLLQVNYLNTAPDRGNIKIDNKITEGHSLIAGTFNQGQINFDNVISNTSSQEGVFVSSFDKDLNEFALEATIHGQENIEILAVARDSSSGRFSIALRIASNSSLLYINNQPVNIISNSDRIYIYNMNDSQIQWSYSFPVDNIDLENFNLTIGKERSIFISFPFYNTIQLPEGNLQSAGDSDIAIIKLSGDLQGIEFYKTFGSEDKETVSKLFYSKETDLLFFGGEYSGTTESIVIGNYRFINPGFPDSSKVYFSYIKDEPLGFRQESPKTKVVTNVDSNNNISIYPNPFKDEVMLKIQSINSTEGMVIINNSLGREVFREKLGLSKGLNTISLKLGDHLLNGVYVLNCYIDKELVGQQKIICSKK
ncbi:MAG: hypothetical protein DHS20C13_22290 [Thermodesulfobacteriota bacterium]|nr:MAG: hypothetical protein DHS20C13_22290 [Thermodesulfobacteriota bacterium]GJM35926.1 MAG: hypothetical protein DHS20C18_49270 [Saprospiraceae bacterium]